MRAIVQRCHSARVEVSETVIGSIDRGLVVFLGVARHDDLECARRLARKIAALRIFDDVDGRFAFSLHDTGGGALVVSNFTLYGDSSKGTRPNFALAAAPEPARELYGAFVRLLSEAGIDVRTGEFGAAMRIVVENDGPVTLLVEADAKPPDSAH